MALIMIGKPEKKEEKIPEEMRGALQSMLNILAYADNTERRLREKLMRKRFDPAAVDYAVRYAVIHGLLNEDRQIGEAIRRLSEKKRYGRRRIIPELLRLGFPREAIGQAEQAGLLDEPDYVEGCKELIVRRGGSREQRDIAYLLRAGFSGDEIREAYRKYREENEEEQ